VMRPSSERKNTDFEVGDSQNLTTNICQFTRSSVLIDHYTVRSMKVDLDYGLTVAVPRSFVPH
jgi:hypothetical protein